MVIGISTDYAGNIYLAEYVTGRLMKYDSNGVLMTRYGSTFTNPTGVAVEDDGLVWVTEQSGNARKITCMN
jgi:streptogramin lyase